MVATALPHPERTLATKAAIAELDLPGRLSQKKRIAFLMAMCEESMRTRFTAVEKGKGPGNEGTDFEDCSARLSLVEEDGRRVKAAARARRPTSPLKPLNK